MLADADETIRLTQDRQEQNLQESYAEAQRMRGQAFFRLGRLEEALQCLENALSRYTELGVASGIPLLEMEIGVIYAEQGDTRTAAQYYNRALSAWEKSGDLARKALLLNNLGVLYHADGKYEQAFTTFEQGLQTCEQCGDRRTQGIDTQQPGRSADRSKGYRAGQTVL